MKIRNKILVYFLVVLLVPTFVLSFFLVRNSQISLENQIIDKLQAVAQIQKNRLQSLLSEKEDILTLFTSRIFLKGDIRKYNEKPTPELQERMNASLAEAKVNTASIDAIIVANTKGVVIASFPASFIGTDISGDELFTKGIKKNDVSLFKKDTTTGIMDEYLTGPLVLNGEILGAVILEINPSNILNVSGDYTGLGKTGETLIAKKDDNGDALFLTPTRFDKKAALLRTVSKDQTNVPSVHAVNGEEIILPNAVDYRGVSVIAVTRFIPSTGWGIVVKMDKDEASVPLKNIMLMTIVVLIFVVFLSGFVLWFFSNSFSGPIKKLTALTKKIAGGDLSQRIVPSSHDEIGELAQSFNTMIEGIKEARSHVDEKVRVQTADILAKEQELEQSAKTSADLAKDLAKFKLAADNVSDQIVITDPEGVVLYGNKMMEKITGYSVEEAIGKKAGALWKHPMPKEYYEEMWRVIKTEKKTFRGQLQNRRKNGVVYEADVSISPVLDADNNIIFYVSIERDITKEKEVDRAKTEFVSLSSHQLRTPISAINWNTEMLLNGDAGEMNEKQVRFLKEIYSSSRRMIALINAFLDVSRVEIGTFSGDPKLVNVNEAAQDILREIHPMIEKKKQHLTENYGANIPTIFTDIKTIHAIFQNLVSNAVKYTKEGGDIGVKTSLSADGKD
ncbi:PAS domain S-box protein, partial [bacterium]